MDIVLIDKTNKITKSNEVFVSYFMSEKDRLARKLASDTAKGGKVKVLKQIKLNVW
jgi:hypothetical protein